MKSRRYNLFNLIHKGIRTYMYDTAIKLQRTDLTGGVASIIVIEQVSQLLDSIEVLANREDHFINGPLEHIDAKVSTQFQCDHQMNHKLIIVFRNLLLDWYSVEIGDTKKFIVTRLTYAFNEFIALNLDHMNREEIELNRILWKNHTDEVLQIIEGHLLESLPVSKITDTVKWIIRSVSESEAIEWITILNDRSSPDFASRVTAIAGAELAPERWQRIQTQLNTEPLSILRRAM